MACAKISKYFSIYFFRVIITNKSVFPLLFRVITIKSSAFLCAFQSASICVKSSFFFLADLRWFSLRPFGYLQSAWNLFFSRWLTQIFSRWFTQIYPLRSSALFNLRISAWDVFFSFSTNIIAATQLNASIVFLKYPLLNFMDTLFIFLYWYQVRSTVLFVEDNCINKF